MQFGSPIPVLRMFDVDKAREFYLGFLGFSVDFEARFHPDAPLYMGLSRGECKLHLSEHHGDSSPGIAIRVPVSDIDAFHAELMAKNYKYNRPGIDIMPWGAREVRVTDPFGSNIHFYVAT